MSFRFDYRVSVPPHQNLINHIYIILTRYYKNIFKSISPMVRVIPF